MIFKVAGVLAILLAALTQASGQSPTDADRTTRINNNTVTIVSGNPNGTYLAIAFDISAVLDDGDDLRILPVIGKGGAQNIRDILYLRGVDMGITQSNILRHFNKTGEFGKNIEQRLRYIARLYNEEMHILVRNETQSIEELRGKKVNFSDAGSGTQLSSRLIFEALGIQVQEVNMSQGDGIEKLRSGEIAATLLIAGKPAGAYAKIPANSGLKFLPMAYGPQLKSDYLPAQFTSEDYPQLIPKGTSVNTIAVGAVLAVYNWPPGSDRHRRVSQFVTAFFNKFEQFQKPPRHPKWRETNLSADLPGWTRFDTAQEIINKEKASRPTQASNPDLRRSFDLYLRSGGQAAADPAKQEELFRAFMEWQQSQSGRQ